MFFRNLYLFRFDPAALVLDANTLEDNLSEKRLRDVGPMELSTRGFVSPFGRGSDVVVHAVGDFVLIALGAQERLLPSDVVNDELVSRVQAIAEKTGRRVGGRERKRIKEEVITELLQRAFVRESRVYAYFDNVRGWLVVNTASRAVAENVVTSVREALGSFPCVPMSPEESPRVLMTDWLASGRLPDGIALGDECELRDPVESGAVVRCKHQELETDEVREHLKSGKQVYRTALCFNDRLSLVLSEDLIARQLRFLDVVQDELSEPEDAAAEFDAIFALQTLELKALLAWIETTFKVSAAPALKLDGGDAPNHMRDAERLAADPKIRDAVRRLAPKKGSGIDSVTIQAVENGKVTSSVTLTTADRERMDSAAKRTKSDTSTDAVVETTERDILFDNAAMIVRVEQKASIPFLQRKLAIGYNRAARILEQLEHAEIVSRPNRGGERTVLQAAGATA